MKKIACNVVTYNRKNMLNRCLDAITEQTYKPYAVYIIDNASTDGTIEAVKSWGYYNRDVGGIRFKYILNDKNEGSSGGQYLGMKTAMGDDEYDGIWVMDDDGVPEKECLEKLISHIDESDYLAPLVVSDIDENILAFGYKGKKVRDEVIKNYSEKGKLFNYACPFNGVLFSSKLISKVGYPKRELFIWGDEENYHLRCSKYGYESVTIVDAIHRHPENRQKIEIFLGREVVVIDEIWKFYCYYRNSFYNKYTLLKKHKCYSSYVLILLYCLFKKKSLKFVKCLTEAWIDGICGNFNKLGKYKKI